MKVERYISNNQLMLDELQNQIETTSFKLDLEHAVIEKDLYVTEIIHTVIPIEHDYYRLIFQGGTCLAKAHKIIPRMSEDCDFRIEMKPAAFNFSREKVRNELRDFRHKILKHLQETGFVIEQDKVRVRNEGKFISMRLQYESLYEKRLALKPFLAIDFFLAEVKMPTIALPVTTLVRNTLGDVVKHPEKNITCISLIETAAEKWIGLTRRIATIKYRPSYNDPALVRHLYDLLKIKRAIELNAEFTRLVKRIIEIEKAQFKNHNDNYFVNPCEEIKTAIEFLTLSQEWRNNWHRFVHDMVFEVNPPDYDEALNEFKELLFLALR